MANLQFYLDNFWRELQSGQDACLQMECHAGQVWLSFHVHVAHPPSQQHHQCHLGPSRHRRRARRAEARAAANAVLKETVADDVDTAEKPDSGQTETNKHNDDLPTSSAAQTCQNDDFAQNMNCPCLSILIKGQRKAETIV